MNLLSFFSNIFVPNIILYVICCCIVILLILPIQKKFVRTIVDPFFYQLWMTALAYVIPFFLYLTNCISNKHFYFFIISEFLFWIGFYLFSKKEVHFSSVTICNEKYLSYVLFILAFSIYLCSTLFTYIYLGIPLFESNRNDVYKDAGGLGLLSRLSGFALNYILIYSYYKIFEEKEYKYKILLCLVITNCVLSGGKSAILSLVFTYFYYVYFYCGKIPVFKKKYLLMLVLFPLIILSFTSSSAIETIVKLGQRFVANGDVYINAYPSDVIDNINISHPISHLFVGFLGPSRLISYNELDTVEPLALLINWEVNPDLARLGITTAPNSRLAICGWVYFKWFGVLFSFVWGCWASFVIYWMRAFFPRTLFGVAFYSSLYFMALICASDPGLSISHLFDFCLNISIYTFVLFLTNGFKIKWCYPQRI